MEKGDMVKLSRVGLEWLRFPDTVRHREHLLSITGIVVGFGKDNCTYIQRLDTPKKYKTVYATRFLEVI